MIANVHASIVNCFELIAHKMHGKHLTLCSDIDFSTFNWL